MIVKKAKECSIITLAVKENESVINADKKNLGLGDEIIELNNYDECFEYLKRL